jgi:hypothetical protein
MDAIGVEAMDKLSATLEELLPPGDSPALAPTLEVHPLRIVPTGLGGFVGLSQGPAGEIVGRRLEAWARVAVKAASVDGLGDAVSAVTGALLAADRGSLRSRGVLRLELDTLGPKPAADIAGVAEREIQFKVLYEFLKLPAEIGDVIQRVPIDLELGRGVPPRTLADAQLGTGSMALFQSFDDKDATGKPGDWRENATEERIEQLANVSSSVKLPENPRKEGTYLVLRATPVRPPVRDFVLRATLRSGEGGGIGLIFRWQDADNFYFFLMHSDAERNYRVFGKKVGGTFAALDTPAMDKTNGFEVGRLYDVKLVAEGPVFQAYLDGERILEGRDATLAAPGQAGLISRNNTKAFFYRFSAVQL